MFAVRFMKSHWAVCVYVGGGGWMLLYTFPISVLNDVEYSLRHAPRQLIIK
jgi:hypothetical protein